MPGRIAHSETKDWPVIAQAAWTPLGFLPPIALVAEAIFGGIIFGEVIDSSPSPEKLAVFAGLFGLLITLMILVSWLTPYHSEVVIETREMPRTTLSIMVWIRAMISRASMTLTFG